MIYVPKYATLTIALGVAEGISMCQITTDAFHTCARIALPGIFK